MSTRLPLTLEINGTTDTHLVSPFASLLDLVRDGLGLTGAKRGCDQGVCGACTVLLDAAPVRACLTNAADCAGRAVTTVEGLADGPTLSPVQQAFVDLGALQCGFCTPAMVLAVTALLAETPSPTRAEAEAALAGNLCRCTGYRVIIDAALAAAAAGTKGAGA